MHSAQSFTPIDRNSRSKRHPSVNQLNQRQTLRLVSHGSVVKSRHIQVLSKSLATSPNFSEPTSAMGKLNRSSSSCSSTIAGKTPHQVQRRNERERRRVQAVNKGYAVLAHQLADWEELKNKKLTKAQTLKAAILYIQHMEKLLRAGCTTGNFASFACSFSPSQLAFLESCEEGNSEEEEEDSEETNENNNFIQQQQQQLINTTTTTSSRKRGLQTGFKLNIDESPPIQQNVPTTRQAFQHQMMASSAAVYPSESYYLQSQPLNASNINTHTNLSTSFDQSYYGFNGDKLQSESIHPHYYASGISHSF